MSIRFYCKDGQGKIVGEKGNDTLDWDVEVTPFHLTTLTRIKQYCEMQEKERIATFELDENKGEIADIVKKQKLLFVYFRDTINFY